MPPVLEVLVGSLSIFWMQRPKAISETGYRLELQRVAMKLATW
jgi:hypothetical protein